MKKGHSPKRIELILIGYKWICPRCGTRNEEEEDQGEVECCSCGYFFQVDYSKLF